MLVLKGSSNLQKLNVEVWLSAFLFAEKVHDFLHIVKGTSQEPKRGPLLQMISKASSWSQSQELTLCLGCAAQELADSSDICFAVWTDVYFCKIGCYSAQLSYGLKLTYTLCFSS